MKSIYVLLSWWCWRPAWKVWLILSPKSVLKWSFFWFVLPRFWKIRENTDQKKFFSHSDTTVLIVLFVNAIHYSFSLFEWWSKFYNSSKIRDTILNFQRFSFQIITTAEAICSYNKIITYYLLVTSKFLDRVSE